MKKIIRLSIFFVGIVLIQLSCANPNKTEQSKNDSISQDSLEQVTKLLQKMIDDKKLAGIAALINIEGETVYRKNFGYSQLNQKTPMSDDAIFRIFSMTKPVTAVALMILFDEGKFELDDKVGKYIPEFKETMVYNATTKSLEPQKNPMTIRHLLTHTSGLTYGWDENSYVDSLYREREASAFDGVLADNMKMVAKLPLKYQPGTQWEYGISIDVAGYLVEVLSGQTLDVFMKERIFEPLQMDDTGFYVPEEKHNRLTSLNTFRNGQIQESKQFAADMCKKPVTMLSGGGGLVSTMDDYLNFCLMLLNGGEFNGTRILEESTVGLIMSDQLPDGVAYANGSKGFGLGGDVDSDGIYGWAGAASTKFWIDNKNEMITIFYTQLMPWNFSYPNIYKETVYKAIAD